MSAPSESVHISEDSQSENDIQLLEPDEKPATKGNVGNASEKSKTGRKKRHTFTKPQLDWLNKQMPMYRACTNGKDRTEWKQKTSAKALTLEIFGDIANVGDARATIENWFKNHMKVAVDAPKKTFITFKPRIRNPGASDLWYSENKEFVKQYAEDNDRTGIDNFSPVKAQLFSELSEPEQKIWEAKATALKDSNEAALEDGASGDAIYRNQLHADQDLCALLSSLIGDGENQLGSRTVFSLRMAFVDEDGEIQSKTCSISIGRTSAKDTFEEFEGGFGAEDERWILRDDSDTLIDKTGKLVLPAWDEEVLTPMRAKELLSEYLIQLWQHTHRNEKSVPPLKWEDLAKPDSAVIKQQLPDGLVLSDPIEMKTKDFAAIYDHIFKMQTTPDAFAFNIGSGNASKPEVNASVSLHDQDAIPVVVHASEIPTDKPAQPRPRRRASALPESSDSDSADTASNLFANKSMAKESMRPNTPPAPSVTQLAEDTRTLDRQPMSAPRETAALNASTAPAPTHPPIAPDQSNSVGPTVAVTIIPASADTPPPVVSAQSDESKNAETSTSTIPLAAPGLTTRRAAKRKAELDAAENAKRLKSTVPAAEASSETPAAAPADAPTEASGVKKRGRKPKPKAGKASTKV
ncbi:hypothetical protein BD410DRAFT_804129 [Rickenella mellea]|uniref:Uncharacterized protein n=1 Tax=Rickenella mellea TaxID=50990 RepID=A0A4Y7Q3T2_9AGAM|nr:hypothetical protein BD410DRAFT_804129 [Rickenella mellea]